MPQHALGDLDQRISLRRKTLTREKTAGGATAAVAAYATVWAKVAPMKGRESNQAMRTAGTADYLVVVRNRSDVQDDDQILWRSRVMNIRFVRRAGPREHFLEIEATMGDPV